MRAESQILNLKSQITRRVRWGVIGSGGIARRRTIPEGIIPAANAQLAAVFDVNAAANAEVAGQFDARPAGSVDDLLGADLDAVYIATPPQTHREQALACAQAGKHVLCEKPLGLNVAEAEEMAAACRQARVRLGTAFMMRFLTQHQAALDLIRAGRLGQPVLARAQLSCWYPPMPGAWRQNPALGGGGALMDMGGHCLDLLEMFFGPVCAVSCFTHRTIHGYASEDSAVVNLRFANGALGMVDSFFCLPDEASQNRLELYGSKGSILATGTIGQSDHGEMFATLQESATGYDAKQERTTAGAVPINPKSVNTYRAEIEEFSQAILDDREPSHHAALGLRSQRVLAACYESARTGHTMEVSPNAS
ncbi:MAG: Gfo/Idh/MocA family oxidoreductase [Verrucomicrobia bacterium]|nr:Gfo/Idh/MocA family oxidoreductase [Verrucomicrobiota bacterium]